MCTTAMAQPPGLIYDITAGITWISMLARVLYATVVWIVLRPNLSVVRQTALEAHMQGSIAAWRSALGLAVTLAGALVSRHASGQAVTGAWGEAIALAVRQAGRQVVHQAVDQAVDQVASVAVAIVVRIVEQRIGATTKVRA